MWALKKKGWILRYLPVEERESRTNTRSRVIRLGPATTHRFPRQPPACALVVPVIISRGPFKRQTWTSFGAFKDKEFLAKDDKYCSSRDSCSDPSKVSVSVSSILPHVYRTNYIQGSPYSSHVINIFCVYSIRTFTRSRYHPCRLLSIQCSELRANPSIRTGTRRQSNLIYFHYLRLLPHTHSNHPSSS